MKKIAIIGALIIALCIASYYVFFTNESPFFSRDSYASGYLHATYLIEGESVSLVDGYFEKDIVLDSASKTIIRYFGNEALGDISGDGIDDVVFLLSRTDGGSGTFYYAVAAIRTGDTYTGTNGIFLGDRIAPQSTEITNGVAFVNYAVRKDSDPLSEQPSLGVTTKMSFFDGELRVVK